MDILKTEELVSCWKFTDALNIKRFEFKILKNTSIIYHQLILSPFWNVRCLEEILCSNI